MIKSIKIYTQEVLHYPWLDYVDVNILISNEDPTVNMDLLETIALLLKNGIYINHPLKVESFIGIDNLTGDNSLKLRFDETSDKNMVISTLISACNYVCKTNFIFPDSLKQYEIIYVNYKDKIHALSNMIREKLDQKDYSCSIQTVDGME